MAQHYTPAAMMVVQSSPSLRVRGHACKLKLIDLFEKTQGKGNSHTFNSSLRNNGYLHRRWHGLIKYHSTSPNGNRSWYFDTGVRWDKNSEAMIMYITWHIRCIISIPRIVKTRKQKNNLIPTDLCKERIAFLRGHPWHIV